MKERKKKGIKYYIIYLDYLKVRDTQSFSSYGELVCDDDTEIFSFDGRPYFIYASTKNKALYEEFMKYRNKDNFLVEKVRFTKDEEQEFISINHETLLNMISAEINSDVIDFVVTNNESNIYNESFDSMYYELEELEPYAWCMSKVLESTKDKYSNMLIDAGVANLLLNIKAMTIGEPVYIAPNFQSMMLNEFRYTFI